MFVAIVHQPNHATSCLAMDTAGDLYWPRFATYRGTALLERWLMLQSINHDDLRIIAALTSLLFGIALLTSASYLIDPLSTVAIVLLDRQSSAFPYPMTVQNLMHLMFVLGLGEVLVRIYCAADARRQIAKNLLPEAEGIVIDPTELHAVHANVKRDGAGRDHHMHRLIHRVILQYRATGSVGESQTVLDSSLELFQHEVGLRYTMLKYLTWLLPTLGFIGTLIGISLALASAGDLPDLEDPDALGSWLAVLTSKLGVAFYTTLVALTLAAVLVFMMNVAASQEERALNETGQYCLDHLINKLQNRDPDEVRVESRPSS